MADFTQYGEKSQEWSALEKDLPAPPADLSLEDLQRITNETRLNAAREDMQLLAPKLTMADFSIPTRDGATIEARTYRPSSIPSSQKLPIYIHFHGGGFFFGSIGSEDATCSLIALDVGVVVINVNYRHTPNFVFPTAWNDGEDAFAWVHEHADEFHGDNLQIVVGGISAGAYITASLMLKLAADEDDRRTGVQGQVLMVRGTINRGAKSLFADMGVDSTFSTLRLRRAICEAAQGSECIFVENQRVRTLAAEKQS